MEPMYILSGQFSDSIRVRVTEVSCGDRRRAASCSRWDWKGAVEPLWRKMWAARAAQNRRTNREKGIAYNIAYGLLTNKRVEMEMFQHGGGGRTRTYEVIRRLIYSQLLWRPMCGPALQASCRLRKRRTEGQSKPAALHADLVVPHNAVSCSHYEPRAAVGSN